MNRVFSPADLERAAPTVRAVAGDLVADLAATTPPVNLSDHYSVPLTSRVICSLLGVPTDDIPAFQRWSEEGGQVNDVPAAMAGIRRMMSYVDGVVRRRRAEPGDDAVSGLLAADPAGGRVHEGRVIKLLAGMLAFGRETPASVIDWGVLLLLTNRDQLALLRGRPDLAPRAVEEVLRLFKPPAATRDGLMRYAHADIEIGPIRVRSGDMVLLDLMEANHDGRVFPDPYTFDITRDPNPHLTFGHGFYMCNFTRLARIELNVGLTTLVTRLPGLRLAEPPDQLRMRDHLRSGGLAKLPVAW